MTVKINNDLEKFAWVGIVIFSLTAVVLFVSFLTDDFVQNNLPATVIESTQSEITIKTSNDVLLTMKNYSHNCYDSGDIVNWFDMFYPTAYKLKLSILMIMLTMICGLQIVSHRYFYKLYE